jgi:hypothetical protein
VVALLLIAPLLCQAASVAPVPIHTTTTCPPCHHHVACSNLTCVLASTWPGSTGRHHPNARTLATIHKRVLAESAACGLYHEVAFQVQSGGAGGFGDRMMGMVTTFYLALLTGGAFAVNWTSPYDLHTYFELPRLTASLGHACSPSPLGDVAIDAVDPPKWDALSAGPLATLPGQRTLVYTNARHWPALVRDVYPAAGACLGLSSLSNRQLFKLAADTALGRPAEKLRAAYQKARATIPAHTLLVGVQIRTGGDGQSWPDPVRHPPESADCFAAEAVRSCSAATHRCAVFLTSDSRAAATRFRAAVAAHHDPPTVIEYEGPILHTDRSSDAVDGGNDPWLKSVLDWWMLRKADHLIVSRSGYGETAAWASGRKAKRLRFDEGNPFVCAFESV